MDTPFETFIPAARIKASRLYAELGLSYLRQDVEDLFQELLLVAWLAAGSFRADKLCSLNTWVNRKMDFFVLDYRREYVRRRVKLEYVGDLTDLQRVCDGLGRFHTAPVSDGGLTDVFESLEPRLRTILSLHLEGYTQEEIAVRCDYRDNSGVAKQLKKIREILSASLKNRLYRSARPAPPPSAGA